MSAATQSIIHTVDEVMNDPQSCKIVVDYLKRLQTRYYGFYQDVIVQKWAGQSLTIYDAFAFAKVHAMICRGEIVAAWVEVGKKPVSDKRGNQINEILKNLCYPFSATFFGGTQGEDGTFNIAEPINLDIVRADTGEHVIKKFSGDFPLEVGYMDAANALYYLGTPCEDGRLARWPYRHDKICLLARVNQLDWREMWEWLGADYPGPQRDI